LVYPSITTYSEKLGGGGRVEEVSKYVGGEVVVYTLLPTHTVLTPPPFQAVYPHMTMDSNGLAYKERRKTNKEGIYRMC
jgi:hypothetical protein